MKRAGLLVLLISGTYAFAADSTERCAGARDLKLINGKIITMDKAEQRRFRGYDPEWPGHDCR
jgi:hypothetical protein